MSSTPPEPSSRNAVKSRLRWIVGTIDPETIAKSRIYAIFARSVWLVKAGMAFAAAYFLYKFGFGLLAACFFGALGLIALWAATFASRRVLFYFFDWFI